MNSNSRQTSADKNQLRDQAFLESAEDCGHSWEIGDFEDRVGKKFSVNIAEGEIPGLQLQLDKIDCLPSVDSKKDDIRKAPFSLLFSGPEQPLLSDGIFKLIGGDGMVIVLYLKPFEVESGSAFYEALFS